MSSAGRADDQDLDPGDTEVMFMSSDSSSDEEDQFTTPAASRQTTANSKSVTPNSVTPRKRLQGSQSPTDPLPPSKRGRGSCSQETATTKSDNPQTVDNTESPGSVFLRSTEKTEEEEEEELEEGWEKPKRKQKSKNKKKTPNKPPPQPRRRLNYDLPPPTFLHHPVVMKDLGTGTVKYKNLGPIVHKFWANTVGEILSQRPLGADRWLIGCKTVNQQLKLAQTKVLAGVHVHCTIPDVKTTGVVQGIPPTTKPETLINHIEKAKNVTRLNKRDGNPSWAIKIDFDLPILPEVVRIGLQEFTVRPYVAPVLTCTTCGRLGHTKHTCTARSQTCRRCGQFNHKAAECKNPNPHCINCGGKHSAAWQGCPEIELRKRANKIKAEKYIVYSEAIRRAKTEVKSEEVAREQKLQKTQVVHDPSWRAEVPLVHTSQRQSHLTYASIVGAPAAQKTRGGTSTTNKPGPSRVANRQGVEPITHTNPTMENPETPTSAIDLPGETANLANRRVKDLKQKSKQVLLRKNLERKRLESMEKNIETKLTAQLSKQIEELTTKLNETITHKINDEVQKRLLKDEEVKQIKNTINSGEGSPRDSFVAHTLLAVSKARESGDPEELLRVITHAFPGAKESSKTPPSYQKHGSIWLLAKYASDSQLSEIEWHALRQKFGILTYEDVRM